MEVKAPQLNTSIHSILKALVKNNEDRLVVLNKTAASIIKKYEGSIILMSAHWGIEDPDQPDLIDDEQR